MNEIPPQTHNPNAKPIKDEKHTSKETKDTTS